MARTEGLLWNQCRMTPSLSELPMASRLMPWWCAIQERQFPAACAKGSFWLKSPLTHTCHSCLAFRNG